MEYINTSRQLKSIEKKRENMHALLVTMTHGVADSVADLDDMYEILTDKEILGYKKSNVEDLFNPNQEILLEKIREIRNKLESLEKKGDQSLLIYITTHGNYEKEQGGHYIELIQHEEGKKRVEHLDTKILAEEIAEIRVKYLLVILDFCFSIKAAEEFCEVFQKKVSQSNESTTSKKQRIMDTPEKEGIELYEAKNIITSTSYGFEKYGESKDDYGIFHSILSSGIKKALENGEVGNRRTLAVTTADLFTAAWNYALERKIQNAFSILPSWGDLSNISGSQLIRSNTIVGYNKRLLIHHKDRYEEKTEILKQIFELLPDTIRLLANRTHLEILGKAYDEEIQYDLLFNTKTGDSHNLLAVELKHKYDPNTTESRNIEKIIICLTKNKNDTSKLHENVIAICDYDWKNLLKNMGLDLDKIPQDYQEIMKEKIHFEYSKDILGIIILSPYMKRIDNTYTVVEKIANFFNFWFENRKERKDRIIIEQCFYYYCKVLARVYNDDVKDFFINKIIDMSRPKEDFNLLRQIYPDALNPIVEEYDKKLNAEREKAASEREKAASEREKAAEKEAELRKRIEELQIGFFHRIMKRLKNIFRKH